MWIVSPDKDVTLANSVTVTLAKLHFWRYETLMLVYSLVVSVKSIIISFSSTF